MAENAGASIEIGHVLFIDIVGSIRYGFRCAIIPLFKSSSRRRL